MAAVLYANPLPTANLNDAAGTQRSNYAYGESDPTVAFDGDTFSLANSAVIDTITTWSVASTLGEALGVEFSQINLYFRNAGNCDQVDSANTACGTWQLISSGTPDTTFDVPGNPAGVGDSNPDISHTNVTYRDGSSFELDSSPGVFLPIWEHTFSNLHLSVDAGATYEFAVNGVGANPDPSTLYGFWYNHYVNGPLSGNADSGTDGNFLHCSYADLSGPCFVYNPQTEGIANKGADFNVMLQGTTVATTPEPATYLMLGVGLMGLVGFARRRAK